MKFIFLYIMSLVLTSFGLFFIIININLLNIGYSFWEYVKYIISKWECLTFFIGILLLIYIYERKIKCK